MLTKIIQSCSLQTYDLAWRNSLSRSCLFKSISKVCDELTAFFRKLPYAQQIGQLFKQISFYLTALLFICIAMPQFATDKQGLVTIVIAASVSWLIGILFVGSRQRSTTIVDALILLFFGINIIATFSSHYFGASLHGLLKLFIYVMAYFLFTAQLNEVPRRQFVFLFILLLSGILVSLYGIYQYKIGVAPLATWEDPTIEDHATRIYATFNNPNLLAAYLVPLIMLAMSLFCAACAEKKPLFICLNFVLTTILSIALVFTGSRGGYLGLAAGFLAFTFVIASLLWHKGKQMRFLLIAALCLAPVLVALAIHYVPSVEHRILSIFAGREHSSNSFRLNVWLSSFAMFKDNWLIGIGVGNKAFELAYGLYMRSGFDALGTYCVPLEIAVESGVFGLLAFTLIILSTLGRAHLLFWQATGMEGGKEKAALNKWLICGTAIAIFALLTHGLVDTVFFRPQIQFIFYLLLAIVVSNDHLQQPKGF